MTGIEKHIEKRWRVKTSISAKHINSYTIQSLNTSCGSRNHSNICHNEIGKTQLLKVVTYISSKYKFHMIVTIQGRIRDFWKGGSLCIKGWDSLC